MAGFVDTRLADWFHYVSDEFPAFAQMRSRYLEDMKQQIRQSNILLPTEKKYGLLIPIARETWAIRDANGVTRGALAGFNSRFVIFNFQGPKHYAYAYDRILDAFRRKENIEISMNDGSKVRLQFDLPINRKVAWSMFNVLMGATGAGTSRDDPARRYALMESTRDNSSRSNAEAFRMIDYIDTIHGFFAEAVLGYRPPSNDV